MSNNVRHIRSVARPVEPSQPDSDSESEPTPLQQAVLERARELREHRDERWPARSPVRWVVSAILALVCFALLYTVFDVVLRKMQQLIEVTTPVAEPAPPEVAPAPQSTAVDQPYFIELPRPEEEKR